MTPRERDPALRRLERDAVVACGVFAVLALAVSGGRLEAALAVLAGGALIGTSYWAIKAGADSLASALGRRAAGGELPAPLRRRTVVRAAVAFVGRYALLALLAYVMIARLRLHPIGLLAGVSSVAAAAAAEAIRTLARGGLSR